MRHHPAAVAATVAVAATAIGLADAAATLAAATLSLTVAAAVGLAVAAAVGLAVAAAGMRVERWHGIALRRKLHPSIAENLVFLLQWQRGGLYQCIHTPHDR